MKKIIIFSTAYLPLIGGAEIAVKEITDRLSASAETTADRYNYEIDLICAKIDRKLSNKEKIGKINVYRVGSGSKLDKLFFPMTGFLKASFLNLCRGEKKYDLIWSIMASHGGLAALFFKIFNPKTPFLLTLQEGDSIDFIKTRMKPFFLFKMIFKKADYIQAISNYLAKWGKEMEAKCPIEVVPNGTDVKCQASDVGCQELRKELNIKPEEKVLITVSRLVPKNGVGDLIEAMQYLDFPFKLLIVGDGQERKNLELGIKNLEMQDKVLFLGSMPNEEVSTYLNVSDVFVRPSLSEGLGNAFLEAIACEVPIIGTSVGGIPDFLIDGETGLFCEVQNPKSIAEKINLLFNDDKLREKLIVNGKKLVEEKYNWEGITQKMQKIFNILIPNS